MNNQKGLCGIINFGNTCWLNTSIQCLLKSELLINNSSDKYINNNTILCNEWNKLVKGIYEDNCIISPKSFFKTIIKSSNDNGYIFNFFNQNDIHEFLNFFIDSMHEEIKHKVDITITGKIKNNLDKMAYEAMKQWKSHFKNNYSSIINLFYGQLVSHIYAVKDNSIHSYNYSPICIFSIPIPENKHNIHFYDCFDLFTKSQLLDGSNKWKNEKDNCYYEANKNLMIWKFPKILIVHFKRFNNNGSKKKDFIDIPIDELDMTKYCIGYDKLESYYTLFGICNHIGSHISGHYYSYCKNINNDKWYEFNDTNVSSIKKEDIITKNAYICFFTKIKKL